MSKKIISSTLGLVVFICFLILNSFISAPVKLKQVSSPTQAVESFTTSLYDVIKVVDGDTIEVAINNKKEKIRLIGIDTPETVDPRKPVQCFGKEASNKAKEMLSGKKVLLEIDLTQGERDKYKRLLRYVFLENGLNFNKYMIEQGFAHEYTYDLPYKYQKEFKQAEQEAMQAGRGLWANNICLNSS